ncbi:unnamed protein product [Clonostachys rosea]|uniref:Major facilitator superfamily (MFS) profile domain-containing protein n=1 Tax=Bionectria ochroleuca TaxID=29856 RepID=A0ABY6UGR9_BIOOC|nr:unnamed protein product [Clonostachys rosea]
MRSWLGRGKSIQLGVTTCCLLAFVLFGYEQGMFDHPSDSQTGIIVSSYNLGCLFGCVVNFFTGEKLGRRKTIWMAMSFIILGTSPQTSSFHVPHLIVGRIITGIGTGLKTSTVPMYQSELCPPTSRGRLVSAEVLFGGVGIVFAYWFNFGMSFVGGAIAWRLPIALQALFAIFVVVLVFALPESPRWLFNHNREQDAIEVRCIVNDMEPTDEFIVTERTAILQAIELESKSQHKRGLFTIFKKDNVKTRYRVLLAWGIHCMNQVSGINLVVYYITSVLEQNVGMSVRLSQIVGGCVQMMLMFGTIIPSFALDRMGRRQTMITGCIGLGLSMLFVAALLSQADGGATERGTRFASASVAFFFIYMYTFGMSVHCVPWVYVPEVLPLEARTQGSAIGISSNWLWNFTVVMITPIIIKRLQWKAYLIFMTTNLVFAPLVYFFYPETSNLRLEDVDKIFTSNLDPVQIAREMQKHYAIESRNCDIHNTQGSKEAATVEIVEN